MANDPGVMPEIVTAPFSGEQIQALYAFQRDGRFHGFTCPNHSHSLLTPERDGWTCAHCDYTQDWAHAFMADGSAL